jgi:hypothetical protein
LADSAEVFETATRSADDKLPSTRLLAMELRSAAEVIPRSAAISWRACQNGSSRLMLVLCPGQHHGSFQDGAGHPLRNVLLLDAAVMTMGATTDSIPADDAALPPAPTLEVGDWRPKPKPGRTAAR